MHRSYVGTDFHNYMKKIQADPRMNQCETHVKESMSHLISIFEGEKPPSRTGIILLTEEDYGFDKKAQ